MVGLLMHAMLTMNRLVRVMLGWILKHDCGVDFESSDWSNRCLGFFSSAIGGFSSRWPFVDWSIGIVSGRALIQLAHSLLFLAFDLPTLLRVRPSEGSLVGKRT